MRVDKYFGLMLLILFTNLASCSMYTGYRGVGTNPSSIQTLIKPGDKVKIVTKDNENISFVVVEITEKAILGESETVLFADITKLQKEVVSGTANFWKNNYTVGDCWWEWSCCDALEYNPEEKEWVCAD